MTRWNLITSEQYVITNIDLIVTSGKPLKEVRRELKDFFISHTKELAEGEKKKIKP